MGKALPSSLVVLRCEVLVQSKKLNTGPLTPPTATKTKTNMSNEHAPFHISSYQQHTGKYKSEVKILKTLLTLLFCLDQGIKAPEYPIKVTHKIEILVSVNALACFKFASLTPNQSGCEQQNSEKIMLVQSVLRCLEFKVHKRKFITIQIFTSPLFFFAYVYVIPLMK